MPDKEFSIFRFSASFIKFNQIFLPLSNFANIFIIIPNILKFILKNLEFEKQYEDIIFKLL